MDFKMSMTTNRFQMVTKTPAEFQTSQGFLGGLAPARPPTMHASLAGGALGHT